MTASHIENLIEELKSMFAHAKIEAWINNKKKNKGRCIGR